MLQSERNEEWDKIVKSLPDMPLEFWKEFEQLGIDTSISFFDLRNLKKLVQKYLSDN